MELRGYNGTDLSQRQPFPVPFVAMRWFVAIAALLLAGSVAWGLPADRSLVIVVSVLYAGILLRWPHAWAFLLPALIPIYDLRLWTGRFFLTEFDVLVLVTLARHYMRPVGHPMLPPIAGWAGFAAAMLFLSYLVSGAITARGIESLTPANINFYLEPANVLRVAKGFVEAWLLWPLLRAADRDGAVPLKNMLAGFAGAGIAIGFVAMWEHGIFKLLADGTGLMGLLSAVLGFSGEYRTTGLFSDMHVGGTSVDGFLMLAVPMAVGAALSVRPLWLRLFCALGAAGALYAAMLTVSRGLLAGVLFSVLLLGIWLLSEQMRRASGIGRTPLFAVPLLLVGGVACYLGHEWGGNEAVAETCLLLAGTASLSRLFGARRRLRGGIAVCAMLLAVAGTLLVHESFVESRWSTLASDLEWQAAVGIAGGMMTLGAVLGRLLRRVSVAALGGGFIAFVVMAGIVLPAVAGSSMTSRLAQWSRDLDTRQRHWQATFDAATRDGTSLLLGKGVGSYPHYYLALALGEEAVPNGLVKQEAGTSYLRQGEAFNLAQRIELDPGRQYRLTGRARSAAGGRMIIKVCPRNVLLFNRYTPQCVEARPVDVSADWQPFEISFDSGQLGRYGPLFLPTTLQIQVAGAIVDHTDLAIRPVDAPTTKNRIANGDFSQGIDRWFLVSDFNHLAWHTKNIFLHLLFEQGMFGLLSFLALLVLGLRRAGRAALAGRPEAAALAATLVGLIPVGMFGTLVDNPMVALGIYLVMLAAADVPALLGVKRRQHRMASP